MFKLAKGNSYSWPVVVDLPVSGGKYEKQSFDAEFKRKDQSEIRGLVTKDDASDLELCKEILVGWKGITDDAGADVPFSESARDRLLEIPRVAAAVASAYLGSVMGEAKRKN